MRVLAVIVTYNRLDLTKQCWESLVATTQPSDLEVVFYDNASSDSTPDWLRTLRDPRLKGVVLARENFGVARGVNTAWSARKAGQYCLKLDNDVVFSTPDWLSKMLSAFDYRPRLGVLGLKYEAAVPTWPVVLPNGARLEVARVTASPCTLFMPRTLDLIGDLYQMQDEGNVYGHDAALTSMRVTAAGFEQGYLLASAIVRAVPEVGHTLAVMARWKLAHVMQWLPRYQQVAHDIATGARPYFWRDCL